MSRVLVVEDEPDLMLLVTLTLRRAGHLSLEAPTGARGLELAAAEDPDVVLLDIRLPDIDGWTVLQELRRNKPGLPVVILSAHASEDARTHAEDLGANAFLPKPFVLAELISTVESLAGQPEPGERA